MDALRVDRCWDLVLVGCGKSKRHERSRAFALYTGPVFRAHWAIAKHLDEFPCILSAQHGLLGPGTEIDPYEHTLSTMSAAERAAWSAKVSEQVQALLARVVGHAAIVGGHPHLHDPTLQRLTPREYLRAILSMGPACGPIQQPRILVMAGPLYIDGWAPGLREFGVHIDDPLRGYTLGERRTFARRFCAETPAWEPGDLPEERGYTRSEQLAAFVDGFELGTARVGEADDAAPTTAQLDLLW